MAARANGCGVFPAGWGGTITDSVVQGMCSNDGGGTGAFQQGIGTPCILRGRTPESSHDVSRLVVCGDSGVDVESTYSWAYAYPDITFPNWMLDPDWDGHTCNGNYSTDASCGDPVTAAACSPLAVAYGGDARLVKDPTYRKTFARHLGGDNLGFADGHAKWMPADQILLGGMDHTRNGIHPQVYYGLCVCTNLTATARGDLPPWTDDTAGDY